MKKIFLFFPIFVLSFFIGSSVFASSVSPLTYSSESDILSITLDEEYSDYMFSFYMPEIGENSGEAGMQARTNEQRPIYTGGGVGGGDFQNYSVSSNNFRVLFFDFSVYPGGYFAYGGECPYYTNVQENYENETENCIQFITGDYTINYQSGTITANTALEEISTNIISQSTTIANNVINNYWAYVLVIGLLFILLSFFANFIIKLIKK